MKTNKNKLRGFWNDSDGVSAKDFIMVLCVGLFALQQLVLFIMSLFGEINPQSIEILDTYDTIVLTIIGGVFSVHVAQEIRSPKKDRDDMGI